jgi:predicted GTPase
MGYGDGQMRDLEKTLNAIPADVVLVATPIDLGRILRLDKPAVRVTYELEEIGAPKLDDVLSGFLGRVDLGGSRGGPRS